MLGTDTRHYKCLCKPKTIYLSHLSRGMDHFDQPANPEHPLIQIPFVATERFDGGDFPGYLTRRGWTDEDISGHAGCAKSLHERSRFLQTWLFFGLLETVFSQISTSDYIQLNGSRGRFVTLSKLEDNLRRLWSTFTARRSISVYQAQDTADRIQRISRALQTAHSYLALAMASGPYNHCLDVICLSIAALGEHVQRFTKLSPYSNWLGNPSKDFLSWRMLSDGWCPTEVSRLLEASSVQILSYISNLDRPGIFRDHSRCKASNNPTADAVQHTVAGVANPIQQCFAFRMDDSTYSTRHADGCEGCAHMIADPEGLVDILENQNSIPLVQCPTNSHSSREEKSTKINLQITSAAFVSKYVAISHVWSDGLGNPHDNSLPWCQILRISNLVRALYPGENVPFWIDTIGVPIKPKEARKKAIMLLTSTYSEANGVLVLDSYLHNLDSTSVTEKELWLRIMQCGWTRRLWTLQEGILAKALYFQCKSTSLDIHKLVQYAKKPGDQLIMWDWHKLRGAFLQDDLMQQDSEEKHAILLRYLSSAVAYRSTSHAEDETLCLAVITGLTPAQIGEIYNENGHTDRMKRFWSLQPHLFTECLFWSGPRIQDYPWRWAPSTFLGQGGALYMGSNNNFIRSAHLSSEGLRFKLPGMNLGTCTRAFDKRIKIFSEGQWFHVDSLLGHLPTHMVTGRLGVILQEPTTALRGPVFTTIPILVVNIIRIHENTHFAHPITIGRIEHASKPYIDILAHFQNSIKAQSRPIRPRLQLAEETFGYYEDEVIRIELCGKYHALEAKTFESQQDWCIG